MDFVTVDILLLLFYGGKSRIICRKTFTEHRFQDIYFAQFVPKTVVDSVTCLNELLSLLFVH